jgi:hypothetical protein
MMFVLEPTSKASVLCPKAPASPALLSIVMPERVRPVAPLTEKPWTGVFLTLRLEMEDVPVRE